MSSTVGLLHYPWGEDGGVSATRPRTPRRAYRRALVYRSNPRPAEYMTALFEQRLPGAAIARIDGDGWKEKLSGADRVVLLYPDATGLGFGSLERRLLRLTRGRPSVLNGRRRVFELDRRTRRALLARRALERSMLVEAAGLLLIGLVTIPLVVLDLIRGRR